MPHLIAPQIQMEVQEGRKAAFLRCPVSGFTGQIAEIVLADGEVVSFADNNSARASQQSSE